MEESNNRELRNEKGQTLAEFTEGVARGRDRLTGCQEPCMGIAAVQMNPSQ